MSLYNCTGREPVRLLHWTRFPKLDLSALGRRLLLHKRLLSNKCSLVFLLITSFPKWESSSSLPRGGGGGGGGGRYSKKFYTRRVCLAEVRLLTLLYTIFYRKGTPIVYRLLKNGTPFHIPSFEFASLLTAVNALSLKH